MKKVSLVLSGGGARGIAHIGVIEELEKQGFDIHAIAGTSMGALVGGVYAAGKLDELKEWVLNIHKLDVFKLTDFTLAKKGFVKGEKVFDELESFIPDVNIEDLEIDYLATATDLTNREEFIFSEGNLLKAIRASVSIPNVLTPVKNGDSVLVDGGVINNLPVNHARRIDDDMLIAVNVNSSIPLPKKNEEKDEENHSVYHDLVKKFNDSLNKLFPQDEKNELSYFDIMNDSYEIMRDELVKLALENHPPDILIEISRDVSSIYDFYKAKELIAMGREVTKKQINDYKSRL